jgi:hypothetical protein
MSPKTKIILLVTIITGSGDAKTEILITVLLGSGDGKGFQVGAGSGIFVPNPYPDPRPNPIFGQFRGAGTGSD